MLLGTVKLRRSLRRERRLNANSFLSEDQELLDALEMWPGEKRSVGDIAKTFRGPIFKRNYVNNPDYGFPYVSAADMDRSDYFGSRLISRSQGDVLDQLRLSAEMIIVTCSGMNLGWSMLCRKDLDGVIGSHDLIRVIADNSEYRGYLGAFLASRLGWYSVRQSISGGSVKHIEPPDVDRLQIPWPATSVRQEISKAYLQAAELRAQSTSLIHQATNAVFASVGLRDLDEGNWFGQGRELGFVGNVRQRTLRAWNLSEKARSVAANINSCGASPLLSLVSRGTLRKGPGFKRIPVDEGFGVHLIGQRQLFRFRPRPKHIAKRGVPDSAFCSPGTTLIAARGTFGEAETFGRAQYVSDLTSDWLFSNDILRVVPKDESLCGWLYAFMRSRSAFRLIRSVATGSKQQDLHPEGLAEIPVPKGSKSDMEQVNDLITQAFALRDAAYRKETDALESVVALVKENA
ncbi:hypothetical protein Mal15_29410 [Stieleria maiorica]|uniref:EcoKI restriction-modification system protein HsdS n=1 Tax=Stieleria maiorica TaxID=2795974 RepID=A0A5B9MDL3_9BACT|nr:hypothetical protein [Stieleria maiorica]QEF98883.1 hypothetical protein Mal15_29410 [Stieleria maiorica]